TIIKIKNENGEVVTFNGDYYLIDVPISEVSEHLFMRWDKETPPSPQIILDTTEPTKSVNITILYDKTMVTKEYKIVTKDGVSGDWLEYKGPINIDKKNTLIYARGMNSSEVWSNESVKKIGNIDDEAPTLTVTGDLETPQQKVSLKVSAVDDVKIGVLKWESGVRDANYFSSKGKEIGNNSIVTVTANGDYTFYVTDQVGNIKVLVVKVTNVDTTPPKIDISVTPETKVGTTANVTIDYNDSVTKQYKVGTSNATWLTYNGSFPIDSYNILSKGWQNEDKTVTIYAKGKDTAGNEITVTRKILNIDLDIPKAPVVTSNYGYPTLTSYGVTFDGSTKIEFDTRLDIDNYYSTDNGVTWLTYKGEFQSLEGTVKAKSVKRDTGLTSEITKAIGMPTDSLKPQAYDGDDTTYISNVTNQHLRVDSSMVGSKIRIRWLTEYSFYPINIRFLDDSKNIISSITNTTTSITDNLYIIPNNTKWIRYDAYNNASYYRHGKIYEISPSNEPTFTITNGYMLLHPDPTKAIYKPYQLISINYFPTSVQQLYKIGDTGNWINYQDKPIWVNQGETIYAKGIDQYGNETRVTIKHTVNVTDALQPPAFDGDNETYISNVTNQYIQVDPSVVGKSVRIKWLTEYSFYPINIRFLDSSKNVISSITNTTTSITDNLYVIPSNTKWIKYEAHNNAAYYKHGRIYEIQLSNEPTFTITNGYMLLHPDPTKAIYNPYQLILINYFSTSVERLYRIGLTGEWLNYEDRAIWVNQGETIYAKGIDKYGKETRITINHTVNVIDALKPLAFDNNDDTYISNVTNQYIQVDPSVIGKKVRIKWLTEYSFYPINIRFLDSSKSVISSITNTTTSITDNLYVIPSNTKWIKYEAYNNASYYKHGRIYEIQLSNEPTFTITNGYMLLHPDPTKAIYKPYQLISINYFPTSVQRLYKIGETGNWINYQDMAVWVNQGETIYAKGIDKYGKETRIITNHTVDVTDALKPPAFDGDYNTYISNVTNQHLQVDPSVAGKRVRIKWLTEYSFYPINIRFLDSSKNVISSITNTATSVTDNLYTIPSNTKWIKYEAYNNASYYKHGRIYEIQLIS
ncbi:MAG: hypothetical protein WDA12_04810, partial [Bacilli bacterium]